MMTYSKGLEGVIAGKTAISHVDGDAGRLSYRGYVIEDLVKQDYITVMWLVLFGDLPDEEQRRRLESWLADNGSLHDKDVALLENLPADLHPMQMLQSMIPVLHLRGEAFGSLGEEGNKGLQIVAKLPALVAAFYRMQAEEPVPAYDAGLSYLGNFLFMFTGRQHSEHEEILKVVQILQMEHSFNASTFTARCVASTLAPVESVMSAAVGALFGVLHGGADEAALNDAKKAGSPDKASAFVDELLANKRKLMGMGHREYKIVDPRSVILKPLAERLCRDTPTENTFRTLEALETAFNERMRERGKDVWANLEFYKGAVYEAIGIPSRYFTSVFAMSRAVGWLAHFMESRVDNRIIRPKADYVGEGPRRIS